MKMLIQPQLHRSGFTLLEAIIVMVVLSIIAVGTGAALNALADGPSVSEEQLELNNALVSQLEYLRGQDFSTLASSTAPVTIKAGRHTYSMSWTVTQDDPLGKGTSQSDFALISVTAGGKTLQTWVTKP